MELTLRPAREEDVPFLTAACSQAIAAGNGTRGTERVTEENRRTFLAAHSGPRHPLFLALRTGKRRADHLILGKFLNGTERPEDVLSSGRSGFFLSGSGRRDRQGPASASRDRGRGDGAAGAPPSGPPRR